METMLGEISAESMTSLKRERRPRTGKKRLKFAPPERFPLGVRELWKSATAAEQARAHQACTQILAMWLGKAKANAVAAELSIPPLRVWQLSQQALSGMLAGLLHQPKTRARKEQLPMQAAADDPRVLKKKISELERQLEDHRELVRLLSSLPKPGSGVPDSSTSSATPRAAAAKTRTRRGTQRGASAREASALELARTSAPQDG